MVARKKAEAIVAKLLEEFPHLMDLRPETLANDRLVELIEEELADWEMRWEALTDR